MLVEARQQIICVPLRRCALRQFSFGGEFLIWPNSGLVRVQRAGKAQYAGNTLSVAFSIRGIAMILVE